MTLREDSIIVLRFYVGIFVQYLRVIGVEI